VIAAVTVALQQVFHELHADGRHAACAVCDAITGPRDASRDTENHGPFGKSIIFSERTVVRVPGNPVGEPGGRKVLSRYCRPP
jgi:hypothetical protein